MDSNIWKINCVDLLTKPIIFAPSDYNRYITNIIELFIIMRLIETKMNNAIRKRQNFSNSNTTVKTTSFFNNDVYCEESKVFLHGNHIATYDHVDKELTLFDGGWQSNTTKSRLNALCNEFATGFSVFQKNWEWFISDFKNVKKEFVDNTIVNYNGCWE